MVEDSDISSEQTDWEEPQSNQTPVVVIVPLGPGETAWRSLLGDLCGLEKGLHIVMVAPREDESAWRENERKWLEPFERYGLDIDIHFCRKGRGRQINFGILQSDEPWVWVLHADSRLRRPCFHRLKNAFEQDPDRLFYFDLGFQSDGPKWMWANEIGTRFRSRMLGMPFGDQGFAFSRTIYHQIGPFKETVRYGEDHIFVWRAHQNSIPLVPLDAKILTSARKYRDQGWLRTTSKHITLTYLQAAPEWVRAKRKFLK